VTFTCLIGKAEAHGKNIALLHPTAAAITLAPLYDTVPTLLWPKLRKDSAMRTGGRVLLTATTVADIVRETRTWGHPAARAATVADELVQQMLDVIDQEVIPRESGVRSSSATALSAERLRTYRPLAIPRGALRTGWSRTADRTLVGPLEEGLLSKCRGWWWRDARSAESERPA
jgi:hypothetical protein